MNKRYILAAALGCAFLWPADETRAQGFLKKLKDKAAQAAEKVVDKKIDEKINGTTGNNTGNNAGSPGNGGAGGVNGGSNGSSRRGRISNKAGGGLENTTPPDVLQQLADAEKANAAANFNEARYAIQQALLGVELQLGKQILQSLPKEVAGNSIDSLEDRVTSSNWGWANLTIQRVYRKGDEQQLTITIGNNNVYSGLLNLYFNNAFVESNGEKQNVKQIRVKGHKAIIQYDDSKGYTLLIPVGQTSIISMEGVNFASEQAIMTAANSFDIDGIKKMLGEQ